MERLSLVLVAALHASSGGAAAPRLVAAFDDPAGDANGPGSYSLPASGEFTDGDFDLRRFTVAVEGELVRFEVTLGAPVRQPEVPVREGSTPLPLANGLYLQNVDVYVDTGGDDPGSSACIPGRRVAFADGRTWKVAVVLTPQPEAAAAIAAEALGKDADRVHFARRLEVRGRTLVARVPASALGGLPKPEWGYAVMISGASWERSFSLAERVRAAKEVNAFTLPVLSVPERWAFGGAPPGDLHPRVLDVLLPPGADQRTVLGSADVARRGFARVPFVYAVAPPPSAPPALPASGERMEAALTVVDLSEEVVSVSGPVAGLKPLQLGRVLAPDGTTAARVVVMQVLDAGLVARVVDGRERVVRGARVVFDRP